MGYFIIILSAVLPQVIAAIIRQRFSKSSKWKQFFIMIGTVLGLYLIGFGVYFYFGVYPQMNKGTSAKGVHWRTEISKADEPNTWPFIESRYMLSCMGSDSNYSVYLVKPEDITFISGRALNFVPQYYGLKGSFPGWKSGETQLLPGQSVDVLQKYVDISLGLCRKAEARKNGGEQVRVEKKR